MEQSFKKFVADLAATSRPQANAPQVQDLAEAEARLGAKRGAPGQTLEFALVGLNEDDFQQAA